MNSFNLVLLIIVILVVIVAIFSMDITTTSFSEELGERGWEKGKRGRRPEVPPTIVLRYRNNEISAIKVPEHVTYTQNDVQKNSCDIALDSTARTNIIPNLDIRFEGNTNNTQNAFLRIFNWREIPQSIYFQGRQIYLIETLSFIVLEFNYQEGKIYII